jgi:hypothetical protein
MSYPNLFSSNLKAKPINGFLDVISNKIGFSTLFSRMNPLFTFSEGVGK